MSTTHDHRTENKIVTARIRFFGGVIVVLMAVLVARLGYLQVGQHQRFSTLAQNNRIHLSYLPPVRGLIYDRNGVVLARNLQGFNLEISPNRVDDLEVLLREIGQLIELHPEALAEFRTLLTHRPAFERQTLKVNLSSQEAAVFAVNQHRFTGVELIARLQRHYPQQHLAAHVVGYVGRISADDRAKFDDERYRGLKYIGKSGIESQYEHLLLGQSGISQVETNAHGRVIRHLTQVLPDTGKTIHLGLDIKLQEKSFELLEGYEGAIVAIEPASGEVLAFTSMPSYDTNPFVNGISTAAYNVLRNSDTSPLLNRALYGRYAPGSTIKAFMSLVGMENGIRFDESKFCPGWFSLPNHTHRYRCWNKSGHGRVDGHKAIVQSCDVYFYNLATQLGIDAIHAGMTRFGFGVQTGVDMPGEPSGLMPSRDWKQRIKKESWFPGETVITGIGQGYMLVTPLQLAAATAMLANRGRQVQPKFLSAVEYPQSLARELVKPIIRDVIELKNAEFYERVITSMHQVVHGARGTARGIAHGITYEMAGKTGTAQVKSIAQGEFYDEEKIEKKYKDHSLFIGFAPLDDPQIAVAVIVEHAGSGSRTAAPIARKLIDYYLQHRLDPTTKSHTADLNTDSTIDSNIDTNPEWLATRQ